MATYGSIPGVRISTSTGTVSGVTIGRAQFLVLVGVGSTNANVSTNDAVSIEGRTDVEEKFGEGSDVANAYERALANGANPDFIQGVRAATTQQSEVFSDSFGSVVETPVVPDANRITADLAGTTLGVNIRNDSPPSPDTLDQDQLYINPDSGEFDTGATVGTDELSITYESANWSDALWATERSISEGQFAVINPLTASSEVGTAMQPVISQMREDMKMAVGVLGAQYNATSSDGEPWIDTGNFTSSFNDDTLFLSGPTALQDPDLNAGYSVGGLGGVAGLMAGNPTTEPIYDSSISGIGSLAQGLTRSQVSDLRAEYIMPLRDTGTQRLEDNRSTYNQETDGGWERDFFRRRIVDLTMVTLYLVARSQIGGVLDSDTIEDVQDVINVELSNLVDDGLLEPDKQEVNVFRADDRTIGVDVTITPLGVAKGADVDLEINA